MAMDDGDVAFFFFCGHSDTGLDLVNTADFSLVSIQPYELAYHAHPYYRTINNLTTNTTIMNIQENPVSLMQKISQNVRGIKTNRIIKTS